MDSYNYYPDKLQYESEQKKALPGQGQSQRGTYAIASSRTSSVSSS
jgi:hypothetical protein